MPFRAIEVKHFANKGKVQKIKSSLPSREKNSKKDSKLSVVSAL